MSNARRRQPGAGPTQAAPRGTRAADRLWRLALSADYRKTHTIESNDRRVGVAKRVRKFPDAIDGTCKFARNLTCHRTHTTHNNSTLTLTTSRSNARLYRGRPLIWFSLTVGRFFNLCSLEDSHVTTVAFLAPAVLPPVLAEVAATALLAFAAFPPVLADAAAAAILADAAPPPVLADAAAAALLAQAALPPVHTAGATVLALGAPPPMLTGLHWVCHHWCSALAALQHSLAGSMPTQTLSDLPP
jgi:hypothetical protein